MLIEGTITALCVGFLRKVRPEVLSAANGGNQAKAPFRRASLVLTLALGLLLVFAGVASAHKVSVFAYAEGGRVFTESYYVDGSKVADSPVEVFDSSGKKVIQGRTDASGQFSFATPAGTKGGLRIVVTASMGHKAETELAASEFTPATKATAPRPKVETRLAPVKETHSHEPTQPSRSSLTQEELGQIREVVSRELDSRLAPIARQLAATSHDRITMTDIIGGLGYIAGLLGVVFFMKGRGR